MKEDQNVFNFDCGDLKTAGYFFLPIYLTQVTFHMRTKQERTNAHACYISVYLFFL